MKRIVLCCDGTWNRADQEHRGKPCPTNVVKVAYRIAKRSEDGTQQVIYYDQGVGTGNLVDRAVGGAFGEGLEANMNDAFRFLIGNYEEGDELYLFGFSRGAFTVRSIAGMIRKSGILKRESVREYGAAIRLYRDKVRRPDHPDALEFKKKHSVCSTGDVPIHFIGVWDTVGARGIPVQGLQFLTAGKYQFHDTELSRTVKHAYHALSIDEKRSSFEPSLWLEVPKPGQTVEQVWFAGVHSDIGGGYPVTELSDLALEWMMEKARGVGLAFDDAVLAALPTDGKATGELHDSKRGIFGLLPDLERPIRNTPTQSLHPSVRERWDNDSSYRPSNLREYFKSIGDPRAGS